MRRAFAVLALWLAVMFSAGADDSGLYIRNRPFKGLVVGAGPTMQVELPPLVEALGLTLRETPEGGLVAGAPPDPEATCPAGSVLVGSQRVAVTKDPSAALLVELQAFCAAAGAKVKPNKSLGTVDVYPNPAGGDGRASAPAKVGPNATPTQVVQGFFAALRILEPLPPITDLLPFFKDSARFSSSLRLCEENLKPLITSGGWTSMGNHMGGMRASLQKAKARLARGNEGAEEVRELQRDERFIRMWSVLTRVWDGMRLADVVVYGEEVKGDTATVDAEVTMGKLFKTRTTLDLVREDGRWKMVKSPGGRD